MNFILIKQNYNMEFSSNKIIYNQTKPTEKSFLVGIPMYMYRIQSQGFSSELNFFQDLVLKFKRQPDTTCVDISNMTGLDLKLLERVEGELIRKNLLSEYGAITDNGIDLLDNKRRIIIEQDTQRLGYVFQYITQTNYYPYYNPLIHEAEAINEDATVISVDVENDSSTEKLYHLNLQNRQIDGNAPSDVEICHLIENTKHHKEDVNDGDSLEGLSKLLSIRFIPNSSPIPVLVCAYIYLPLVNEEEGIYSTEWKVTNPFADGDSEELELYLKSLNHPGLKRKILNEFREADTDINRKYAEVDDLLESETANEIRVQFGTKYEQLDDTLSNQVKNTIRCYVRLQHINNFDYQGPLFLEMQKTIESILAKDVSARSTIYRTLDNAFDKEMAFSVLTKQLNRWTGERRYTNIRSLQNAAKGAVDRQSMLSAFAAMIMTRQYNSTASVFNVFRNHVQYIINLRFLRNDNSHGGRELDNSLSESDSNINLLYNSYIQIINSYIEVI